MLSANEEAMICSKCGGEATYIEEYKRFYCYSCNDYIEHVDKGVEGIMETKEKVVEETNEVAVESPLKEDQDLDSYLSELYSAARNETETQKTERAESEVKSPPSKRKKIFKKYRYRTRLLKGSILPILFGVISIQMLSKTVYDFAGYYEYELIVILFGFLLGLGTLFVIIMPNLVRAKKSGKRGCELNTKLGIIALLPFLIILFTLVFFYSISIAWRFGTGFFFAAIFPPIIVVVYEAVSKGKFFVREAKDDPSKGRKLVFIQ
jgi:cation transport ATPase